MSGTIYVTCSSELIISSPTQIVPVNLKQVEGKYGYTLGEYFTDDKNCHIQSYQVSDSPNSIT